IRTLAEIEAVIQRVLAHGDTLNGPEPLTNHGADGVAAKFSIRAFIADFRGNRYVAFQNDFGSGGNFQIDGFTTNQFHRSASQSAGNRELVDADARDKLRTKKDR